MRPGDPPGRLATRDRLLLTALSVLLFGVHLGSEGALTDHEIYDAGMGRQMAETGRWGLPWIGDALWLDKPPLPTWLTGLSIAVFGPAEWAARLPAALAGLGVVLLMAGLAARWFGRRVGLLTGLVLVSSRYMTNHARLAEADILLCLLVVAAIGSFGRLQDAAAGDRAARRWWCWLFWTLVGLSSLVKGPAFGAAHVALAVGGSLAWRGRWAPVRRLWSPAGIATAILIAAAWPAAVALQGHGPELWDWWLRAYGTRAIGTYPGDGSPPWYYPLNMTWQLLPWTPLLLAGIGPSVAAALRDRASKHALLWSWILLPTAALSLPAYKHHHYLVPALPALAPVIALGLSRIGDLLGDRPRLRRHAGWAVLGLGIVLAVAAVAMSAALPEVGRELRWIGLPMAAGLAATGLVLLRAVVPAFAVLVATITVTAMVLRSPLIPRNDPSAEDRLFLMRVAGEIPAEAPLVATGGSDLNRFTVYVGRAFAGVFDRARLAERLPAGTSFVLGRGHDREGLAALGTVTLVDQSARTRFEQTPDDRFTLFRLDRP